MKDSDNRQSSSNAQPTGSTPTTSPTVHGTIHPTNLVQQDKPDEVSIEDLKVSVELQNALEEASRYPNLVCVAYILPNDEIRTWWQTRRYPGDALKPALDHLWGNLQDKLLGRTPIVQLPTNHLHKVK